MTDIYIARHGITESNKKNIYMGRSDERLAPEGAAQAEALGKSLQSLGIRKIYSSPVQRAVETSEIVGEILKAPIEIEEDLVEMKLQAWAGLSEEEVAKRWPDIYYLWNTKPGDLMIPGKEPLREVHERALRAILRIKEKNDGYSVLAITHVALIRCLIIHFQKMDIHLYRTITVPNTSVHRVQWDGDSASMVRFL